MPDEFQVDCMDGWVTGGDADEESQRGKKRVKDCLSPHNLLKDKETID